jgi:hypothetical protein
VAGPFDGNAVSVSDSPRRSGARPNSCAPRRRCSLLRQRLFAAMAQRNPPAERPSSAQNACGSRTPDGRAVAQSSVRCFFHDAGPAAAARAISSPKVWSKPNRHQLRRHRLHRAEIDGFRAGRITAATMQQRQWWCPGARMRHSLPTSSRFAMPVETIIGRPLRATYSSNGRWVRSPEEILKRPPPSPRASPRCLHRKGREEGFLSRAYAATAK